MEFGGRGEVKKIIEGRGVKTIFGKGQFFWGEGLKKIYFEGVETKFGVRLTIRFNI